MIHIIHSEFRKLLTVRSTYIVSILALIFCGFVAFYGSGFKSGPTIPSNAMELIALQSVTILGLFAAIVAILLVCHEYRYNTIAYTLTISNNRLKVLVAKVLVITTFAAVLGLIGIGLCLVLFALGVQISGHVMSSQSFAIWAVIWKVLAYMIGGSLFGLVLGFLFRSLVFSIAAFFIVPIVEQLLQSVLKVNGNYLPIMAQNQIVQMTSAPDVNSPLEAAGVFALYLVGLWLIAAVLFVRRDAS